MKNFNTFLLSALPPAFVALASCVSTETVEPEVPQDNKSGMITLNISGPENFDTRADASKYKLRYTAWIYQGESVTSLTSPLDRKEILADTQNDDSDVNQIIFSVNPDKYYHIMVFADYIPIDSKRGTDKLYPDYFYNTHVKDGDTDMHKLVRMRTTPNSNSYNTVSKDFFNNDNYDCFFHHESLYKEEAKWEKNIVLDRLAARVSFEDNSGVNADFSIQMSSADLYYQFTMDQEIAQTGELSSSPSVSGSVSDSNRELFYFYTLADASKKTFPFKFKLTQNGTSKTVEANSIPVMSNYKTIVRSAYLTGDSQQQVTPETPSQDPVTAGDIILNLSTGQDWEQTTLP